MVKPVPLRNLKAIRINLGMSQNSFGDVLGFPRHSDGKGQSYYRKYESGHLALSAEHAYRITRLFTITLKQLLEK